MRPVRQVTRKISSPTKRICKGTVHVWRNISRKNSGTFKIDNSIKNEELHPQSRYFKFNNDPQPEVNSEGGNSSESSSVEAKRTKRKSLQLSGESDFWSLDSDVEE
ncbi:uncharacterized protein LOC123312850 isoform X2 [Coccinella septempunctata]|uniref:uncharacterized protein LOC123312850 isoform X2 n=1 Tax=Coccinella septempunctata TaxID=41139 RepID=UPI001D096791|nr:uncharacterized protein LOC123312850 isoform X2 [Coccinella septempunctata]